MPIFERDLEINAPVKLVWDVLTDPNHWAEWLPGVDSVSSEPVQQGATFTWTAGGKSGQGKVTHFDPLKRMALMTQLGDDQDAHEFTLKASGGFMGMNSDECKVHYSLDTLMGGGILANFVAGGNPKDALRVNKALHMLSKVVESQLP